MLLETEFWNGVKLPTVVYAQFLPVNANLSAAVGGLLRESRSQISSPWDKRDFVVLSQSDEPLKGTGLLWANGIQDVGGRPGRRPRHGWGVSKAEDGAASKERGPVAQSQGTELNNQPEWVWKQLSLRAPGKNAVWLTHPEQRRPCCAWTSDLQNCERMHFSCFKPQSLSLLQ